MILFFLLVGSSVLDARSKRYTKAEQFLRDGHSSRSYRHKRHRRKKTKSASLKNLSDEKKIQKSLAVLGFYHGAIDGEVNGFETRQAIKAMNIAYRHEDTAFLNRTVKDTLVYLANLYQFDQYLHLKRKDKKTKNIKLQTALKIFAFYDGKIDAVVGKGMRESIRRYKQEKGLSPGEVLDFEEEYQLISLATEENQKNIKETEHLLKVSVNPLIKEQVRPEGMIKVDKSIETHLEAVEPTYTKGFSSKKKAMNMKKNGINEENEGISQSECSTLASGYDTAVLANDTSDFNQLEATADILVKMCHIQKTKTGNIRETMKRLKQHQ